MLVHDEGAPGLLYLSLNLIWNTLLIAMAMALIYYCLIALAPLVLLRSGQATLHYLNRLRIKRERNCQPPPSISQNSYLFGFDLLFGFLHTVKQNRVNLSLKDQFEKYGHTFQSRMYGRTKLSCIEPQNIQSVFAKDSQSWGLEQMRLFALKPFVGKGIMNTDGAFWEHSRALIRPTFARTQIADLHLAVFETHISRLLDLIPKDGSIVDLQPLFARLGLDSSTEFLFGESVKSLDPEAINLDAQAFLAAYNYGQTGAGKRMQMPQWNFLTRDKQFWESCKLAHSFVDGYVSKALQRSDSSSAPMSGGETRYVLAYELSKETRDRDDIRNQLLNVFLPAHDATAVVLTNVFFHLARHPDIYVHLRQELFDHNLLTAYPRDLTLDRLKGLRYLQCVVDETLRLNPTIGIISRAALKDTILPTGGGFSGDHPILVNKGDILSVSLYALHRRRDIYGEDADVFRPERWKSLRPGHYQYMPFGRGPRICPGQQLALAEVLYAVVRFLQTFKALENRDPVYEFVEQYKISTESKNGAKVTVVAA